MLNSSHPVKEGSCLYCILTNKHTIGQFVILPLPVYCYVFKVLSLSKKIDSLCILYCLFPRLVQFFLSMRLPDWCYFQDDIVFQNFFLLYPHCIKLFRNHSIYCKSVCSFLNLVNFGRICSGSGGRSRPVLHSRPCPILPLLHVTTWFCAAK